MRNEDRLGLLEIADLSGGALGLTLGVGGSMAEAASVCLEKEGHGIWLALTIDGIFEGVFDLRRLEVTEQMKAAHGDPRTATENGACGIAILVLHGLTGLKVLEQAVIGTGFDYWLVADRSGIPFQRAVRLEVSGIRKGDASAVRARVQQKFRQTEGSGPGIPLLVAVVEFSRATMKVLRRW